ncbi:MAG: aconitate hydratase, partial [Spirochaetales bacterium]|nr:aconitate hydratase [Spirochaetales bacterium]
IVPLTFKSEEDYEKFDENDELVIENIKEQITGRDVVLKNKTKAYEVVLDCDITDEQRAMLISGGLLNILKERG